MKKKQQQIEENFVEKDPFLKKIEKQEERGIIKIGFDEPIQTIKKVKKLKPKPQEQEIQEVKTAINRKKPKIADIEENEDIEEETDEEETDDIKQLENEIKRKKKLLRIKKEEERLKEEKRLKEEELKKLAETSQQVPQEIKGIETQEVKLNSMEITDLKFCPVCKAKIKGNKVARKGFVLTQYLKCKKCNWEKEIILRI